MVETPTQYNKEKNDMSDPEEQIEVNEPQMMTKRILLPADDPRISAFLEAQPNRALSVAFAALIRLFIADHGAVSVLDVVQERMFNGAGGNDGQLSLDLDSATDTSEPSEAPAEAEEAAEEEPGQAEVSEKPAASQKPARKPAKKKASSEARKGAATTGSTSEPVSEPAETPVEQPEKATEAGKSDDLGPGEFDLDAMMSSMPSGN